MLDELKKVNEWRKQSPLTRTLAILAGLYLGTGVALDTYDARIAPHMPDFCQCQCDQVAAAPAPTPAPQQAAPPPAAPPAPEAPPRRVDPPRGDNIRAIQGTGDGAPAPRLPGE